VSGRERGAECIVNWSVRDEIIVMETDDQQVGERKLIAYSRERESVQ